MMSEYDESSITVLDGISAIRKVPGMYIGYTDHNGVHHLFEEVISNSIDEHLSGNCTSIVVSVEKDGGLTVSDNGRGIPCEPYKGGISPKGDISTLEVVLTKLHSGGKFGSNSGYKVSGGLHGVGLAVVNALSKYLKVEVRRDKKVYTQEYKKGVSTSKVRTKKNAKQRITGTKITFFPDNEIFKGSKGFDLERIRNRLKELSYLNKGLTLKFSNGSDTTTFHSKQGIISFINDFDNDPLYPPIFLKGKKNMVEYEVIFTHSSKLKYGENHVISFVNNIRTIYGGYHEASSKHELYKYIKSLPGTSKVEQKDVESQLVMVVSILHQNPEFSGQTKEKFSSRTHIPLSKDLEKLLSSRKWGLAPLRQTLKQLALKSSKKRLDLEEAKKSSVKMLKTKKFAGAGKLASATSSDSAKRELFIVEGDSAGGSAKLNRNKKIQAVLPLKGKLMNVYNARLSKILANKELVDLISVIGTGIGKDFNYSNLQYGKIIILTDADSDGAHITALLLGFFYKYMKELVLKNHIYVAIPPLYKVSIGKKQWYIKDQEELEEFKQNHQGHNLTISRFKGLGEMNPEDLYKTTMDPENRTLIQITVPDIKEADQAVETIFGSTAKNRLEMLGIVL